MKSKFQKSSLGILFFAVLVLLKSAVAYADQEWDRLFMIVQSGAPLEGKVLHVQGEKVTVEYTSQNGVTKSITETWLSQDLLKHPVGSAVRIYEFEDDAASTPYLRFHKLAPAES